jgi:hypothetical protein
MIIANPIYDATFKRLLENDITYIASMRRTTQACTRRIEDAAVGAPRVAIPRLNKNSPPPPPPSMSLL